MNDSETQISRSKLLNMMKSAYRLGVDDHRTGIQKSDEELNNYLDKNWIASAGLGFESSGLMKSMKAAANDIRSMPEWKQDLVDAYVEEKAPIQAIKCTYNDKTVDLTSGTNYSTDQLREMLEVPKNHRLFVKLPHLPHPALLELGPDMVVSLPKNTTFSSEEVK